ncbi:PLAC8 family protein [Colletotrichum truncatum]|uniref:PLAC8 family protein n=1 Tax=Colletotrichum truncatum TaxID=5467 RepID=A0ACC3Z808_COLTU|nr:PLAC8 family protein [Colletotrichum truncatum]KAF6783677.1 PLAC8 family protein [Colletotrichum truncatum]
MQQQREWNNSLLDCSPCGTCMMSTFLPCIVLGKTSERMRDPKLTNYSPFNGDCVILSGLGLIGFHWLYIMSKRIDIRKQFGIEGSQCGDCCAAYWCPCCSVIQQEKEVIDRTEYAPVTQGYESQKQGMHMG